MPAVEILIGGKENEKVLLTKCYGNFISRYFDTMLYGGWKLIVEPLCAGVYGVCI